MRALIYCRASADPTGRSFSVESQETEDRAWCQREGWEVAGVIVDNDRSASRWAAKEREGYEKVAPALAGTTHGVIHVLVCWESSRANRDLEFYVGLRNLCAEYGVLYAYKGRVYDMASGDDRFSTGMDALVDEREAERARDRTLRGHRLSVTNGTPRGFTPYGYRRVYDPNTGRLQAQVIDPPTAAIIKEITACILRGDTLYAICKDLNGRGVLSPRARHAELVGREASDAAHWTSSIIRNLLARRSLIGIRTHKGQAQRAATWDPILSPADWEKVQAILADPTRARQNGGVAVRYLLSGIAECGVCGAWLRPFTNRGRATYRCDGKSPTSPRGHVTRMREPLDAFVVAYVCALLADPQLAVKMSQRTEGAQSRSSAVAREIADLQVELAQYVKSAAQRRGLAAQAFAQVADDLAAQIEAKERELELVAGIPAVVPEMAGPDAPAKFSAAGLVVQRKVVRALVRVVVHRTTVPGSRTFDASTIQMVGR